VVADLEVVEMNAPRELGLGEVHDVHLTVRTDQPATGPQSPPERARRTRPMFGRRSRTSAVPPCPPPRVEITAADVLLIEQVMRILPGCHSSLTGPMFGSSFLTDLPRALYERIGAASATTDPEAIRVHLDAWEITQIEQAAAGVRDNHTGDGWHQCRQGSHTALLPRADVLMRRLYIGLGHARAVQTQPAPIPAVAPALPRGEA
jgi:hypothetical protein